MLRTIVCIGISLSISGLGGCSIQEESGLQPSAPTNEVSSVADSEVALSDGGIAAPAAPTLSISATAGALNFTWVDWRINAKDITATTLYEYNSHTEKETELKTDIEPGDLQFIYPIAPHRLAWNAISYRVEICSNDNCISSLRTPVRKLLAHSITGVTPSNSDIRPSFGDDLAINANGNVAVASSPITASAAVLLHNDQQWIQASTLTSEHFSAATDADMRVAVSASGDTVAIASAASTASPTIVIFDRLGENWIETALITAFETMAIAHHWDPSSLSLQLSDNGDRLVFAAHPRLQSVNKINDKRNQVLVFDRTAFNWMRSATLTVPLQHTRYLHEYSLSGGQWHESAPQILDAITPSIDTRVVSSHDLTHISLAAWERDSDTRRSAVGWKFEKRTAGWIAIDSIRMPPTVDQSARLRLASDAQLQSLAIGWQAQADANLSFYAVNEQHWQHQFSVPEGLDLQRALPFVQSIAVSANNSTALIGTTNTGTGGVVSSFR